MRRRAFAGFIVTDDIFWLLWFQANLSVHDGEVAGNVAGPIWHADGGGARKFRPFGEGNILCQDALLPTFTNPTGGRIGPFGTVGLWVKVTDIRDFGGVRWGDCWNDGSPE